MVLQDTIGRRDVLVEGCWDSPPPRLSRSPYSSISIRSYNVVLSIIIMVLVVYEGLVNDQSRASTVSEEITDT